MLQFRSSGITYSLVVTAQGTPITVPNPQTAGCLSGQVDYITYSLQLIAAGLPDEVSIGGQKACPSCTVKQPLYPRNRRPPRTRVGQQAQRRRLLRLVR